ncbi:hypothetical protein A2867_04950 [Candidatus Daviesbacteria bacterium RIFCSPHIGHO2_01_FULL_40_11]|uniref:Uncharacterized protein n=1 Tax=Candidatus Daviesbacteria bacterium RIFCSPHIGHO2_01_FULL_40_11 TaxID=1797762 RepID=A0A1F5JIL3_9BACT|nr:MAG: hypothetical protein A2867_04950 [Candidatus Daviesbacteria bacterium RIFCSPHIGHO2_01_FULL_40_11]
MFARIFALLLTTSYLLLATPAFAQTPSTSSGQAATPSAIPATNYQLPATIPPTSPLYTDLLVNNMFHTFSCLAIGQSVIGQPCLTYQMTRNAQGMLQGVPVLSQANLSGGTLGAVTSVIGMLYENPPVRTADYLASVGTGLGIVKEAKAQGVTGSGAAVLNPILKLWQVSRNISYVILILIFLVIGLMIMFRNKINPQTVITAQTALPGLVIGLVMITFSYFFAGLISDFAFVGTNIVGYYFAAAQGKTDDATRVNLVQQISPESVLSIFSRFTGIINRDNATDALNSIWNGFDDNVKNTLSLLIGILVTQFVSPLAGFVPPPAGLLVGPALSVAAGGAVATFPTFFLGLILGFIATLALIYAMLKLALRLVNSYITIIFLTLIAPFQFLFASLPGRQGVATGWMLNILANVLVFPTVLAVFYLVAFILGQSFGPLKVSQLNQTGGGSFVPVAYAQEKFNIIGNNTFPLFGGMNLEFIRVLLAFGLLMALPTIPDIVVKSIGKAGQAGQMIGQEIFSGARSGQGYFGRATGAGLGFGQSAKTSIWGEKQFSRNAEGNWVVTYGKPGAIDIFKGRIDMNAKPDGRSHPTGTVGS